MTVAVEVEVAVFGITFVEVVEIVRVAVLDNVDERTTVSVLVVDFLIVEVAVTVAVPFVLVVEKLVTV